jgi:hypothetical protein
MKLRIVPVLVAASGLLAGCSSSPLSGAPETDTGTSDVPSGGIAPTSNWAAYPAGPYGTIRGATIENLSFRGWAHPDLADYEPAKFEVVRLSDFYDPDGKKGVKLLAINASAVWCGVCRAEYADMNTAQTYSTLQPMGLEILGTLFEDNASFPAQPQDLKNWGKSPAHAVKFPLVLDPGFKLGAYFDSDATPLNMLIDTRTMTIVQVTMGYSATYWSQVQTILQKL